MTLFLLAAFGLSALADPGSAHARVRILVPAASAALPIARELPALVQEYNEQYLASHPGAPSPVTDEVQLLRRGEGFSALKELMALSLAGDAPDLAGIEPHESAALAGSAYRAARIVPFERTFPVLVWNPEHFRGDLVRERKDLLAAKLPEGQRIAVPLQGVRGLWILEDLLQKPLWKRELGGLRANRELASGMAELQASPKLAPDTWENSVQAFIDGRAPALVASTDALPLLQAQTKFKWKAAPFPYHSPLMTGTDLVVLHETPGVAAFLKFLMSPGVAARWGAAGGFWPLSPEWTRQAAWKSLAGPFPRLVQDVAVRMSPGPFARQRTTDPQVVRATTEWIAALRVFFKPESSLGPEERRFTPERVFDQLDAVLGAQPNP